MNARTLTLSLLSLALAVAAGQASAATSATGVGSATVIVPMNITKGLDLRFGSFAPSTAAGTIVLSTAGARTASNVSLSTRDTGGAATFAVTGDTNYGYNITIQSSTTLTGPGTAMTLNGFTSSPSASGTLTSGAATILVGGTLNVGASQAAGAYTGNFTVSVDYN